MLRHIASFYLLAMLLCFAITLVVGARGAPPVEVMTTALLAWPMSFFLLLAGHRLRRILSQTSVLDR